MVAGAEVVVVVVTSLGVEEVLVVVVTPDVLGGWVSDRPGECASARGLAGSHPDAFLVVSVRELLAAPVARTVLGRVVVVVVVFVVVFVVVVVTG